MSGGWGYEPWGAGPWGAGGVTELQLLRAYAVRENVVRIEFNAAPQFTKLLTPNDASNPERFSITVVAGSSGLDGEPARTVRPVLVTRPAIANSLGSILDVTTDRPFSPWNSQYIVACNQLMTDSGVLLDPSKTSFQFAGVYRQLRIQSMSNAVPSRDIANPATYAAQLDPLPQAGDPLALGIIPIGSDGDYAFDDGITQVKKRIFRRLLTRKGAFPALPDYGIGVPSYGKKLGSAGVRQMLAAETERQLKLEPDILAVKVHVLSDIQNPEITLFRIRVKIAGSQGNTQFDIPFAPV
jgi:hypothetical protein